jgi:hypothetical protein
MEPFLSSKYLLLIVCLGISITGIVILISSTMVNYKKDDKEFITLFLILFIILILGIL